MLNLGLIHVYCTCYYVQPLILNSENYSHDDKISDSTVVSNLRDLELLKPPESS